MKSDKVRKTLKNFINKLPKSSTPDGKPVNMGQKTILWKGYQGTEKRVALALNPFRIKAKARPADLGWKIEVSGWVRVRYPPKAKVKLFSFLGKPFYFEEGLFWALQRQGWLFPYKANWSWTIYSDDPRLWE